MANKFLMRAVAAVVSTLAAASACAEAVSADSAGVAAQRWLRDDAALGCALGSEVEAVRTCSPQSDASFHVVRLKGGGFIVMSSDTTREPVVAFSSGGDLLESDSDPLWVLLKNDLAIRASESSDASAAKSRLRKATAGSSSGSGNEAKWNRLLGKSGGMLRAMQGVSAISDVRVAPLVQSKWGQDNVGSTYCYNYYTPNHYVCGCVATAGAQIMRYFQWPSATTSVPAFQNDYCCLQGVQTSYTTQGGYYDWSQMPLVPNASITDAQRQAIGKLTSDIGICVGMDYDTAENGGSAAGGYMLAEAFTNHYGYANALAAQWSGDTSGSDDMKNALLSNFDAGLPVAVSLSGDSGHEIVGDGYGYSGETLYLHFNMGWGGHDNAWYAPPQLSTSLYDFNVLNGFVCNVFTNQTDAGGVICSGRVLDASGAPIANAVVSAKKTNGSVVKSTTTNEKGIYALVITGVKTSFFNSGTSYRLTATSGGVSATKSVSLTPNVGTMIVTSGEYFGQYYPNSVTIGNRCGQDITIGDIAGVAEPQFNPTSCLFYPSTNVTITCATAGATIRYTTDGTDPTESSSVYSVPIFVDDDTMIKARALAYGLNPSAVATETYTYDASQGAPKGDYFADPINITGASGSRVIDDNSTYTVETGEPMHTRRQTSGGGYIYSYQYRTIWYKWTAPGSGTMTLQTSCSGGGCIYPTYIAVYTGDTLALDNRQSFAYEYDSATYVTALDFYAKQGTTYRIVGMMGYDGSGTFTLTWSGELTEVPTETSTTEVPVQYDWLSRHFPESAASEYETVAHADSDGDGIANWAEYLLGTDPTNSLSKLEVTIRMDGATPVIESNADAARLAEFGYQPVLKGKQQLDATSDWAPTNLLHRFFKIFVEKQ